MDEMKKEQINFSAEKLANLKIEAEDLLEETKRLEKECEEYED